MIVSPSSLQLLLAATKDEVKEYFGCIYYPFFSLPVENSVHSEQVLSHGPATWVCLQSKANFFMSQVAHRAGAYLHCL